MKNNHENQGTPTFEEVTLEFIEAWEQDEAPSLPDFIQRYPQFGTELVDFVLEFTAFNNAAENTPESTATPHFALKILGEMMAASKAENLSKARESRDWSFNDLMQHLKLPQELGLRVIRGYEDWGSQIEAKVASIFSMPPAAAARLLANTGPLPATQFKATGQPSSPIGKRKSFQEDLEEFRREGKLTSEQEREWFPEDTI